MTGSKSDIIARLQREILPLQGYRSFNDRSSIHVNLGPVNYAFPGHVFPTGAVHEFACTSLSTYAATCGFTAGIMGQLMKGGGASLWISTSAEIFAPGLAFYGIDPDKIIFIQVKRSKDLLWTLEEALKCKGLASVTCETQDLNFTSSRRLQIAVEQSGVTGFLFRRTASPLNITTCVCRWQVQSLPGLTEDDTPGIGLTQWNVNLLKVRNGKPGNWQLLWEDNEFRAVHTNPQLVHQLHRKTG